jgi:redox-sensitive bicupin YhaK (pirin superfamily)
MSKSVIHQAATRGEANHGWLKSHHTFSFGSHYNPDRMNFGTLRVLNDDQVDGGMGFGEHPHDNMEIISIALEGALKHEDSMGNVTVIETGEIQVMSAGTGIYHKEFNRDANTPVKFLQIWVFPNKRNVAPRYDQKKFDLENNMNTLVQILSPNEDDAGVWIYQNAWFNRAKFDRETALEYPLHLSGNGVYVFVLGGEVTVGDQQLSSRDGYGLWDTTSIAIKAAPGADILLMEVPMQL